MLLGERGWIGKIPDELHPELAQVPFVIVHPDGRGAGEVSDHFASTHDVAPTILSLLGIDAPAWMNGQDLSPILDAPSGGAGAKQQPARDWHYGGMFNRYFVRTDDWVLLGDNLGGNRKLYDLNTRPRRDPRRRHRPTARSPRASTGGARRDGAARCPTTTTEELERKMRGRARAQGLRGPEP